MRKYIILSLLFVIGLVACEKSTEKNDGLAPEILKASFGVCDTVFNKIPPFMEDGELVTDSIELLFVNIRQDLLRANLETIDIESIEIDSTTVDTIVLGSKILFTGQFRDDQALGFYKLVLEPLDKTVVPDRPALSKAQGWSISGVRDTTVNRVRGLQTVDSLRIQTSTTNTMQAVRTGAYVMSVYCMDAVGNETAIRRKVMMVHREDIIADRSKFSDL